MSKIENDGVNMYTMQSEDQVEKITATGAVDETLKALQISGKVIDLRNASPEEVHGILNSYPCVPVPELHWVSTILNIWKHGSTASANVFAREAYGDYKPRVDMHPLIYTLMQMLVRGDDAGSSLATRIASYGSVHSLSLVELYGAITPYTMKLATLKMAYLLQAESAPMRYDTVTYLLPSRKRAFEVFIRRVPPTRSPTVVDDAYMADLIQRLRLCYEFLDFTDIYTNSANLILLISCVGSKHPLILCAVLDLFAEYATRECPKRTWPTGFFTPVMAEMLQFTNRVTILWEIVKDRIPKPWHDDGIDFTAYTLEVERVEEEHNIRGCTDMDNCPFVHGEELHGELAHTMVGPMLNKGSRIQGFENSTQKGHHIYARELFVDPDDDVKHPAILQDVDFSELF